MSSYSHHHCISPLCHKLHTKSSPLDQFPFPYFPTKDSSPDGSVKPAVPHIQADSESHLGSAGPLRHDENTCHEELNSFPNITGRLLLALGI